MSCARLLVSAVSSSVRAISPPGDEEDDEEEERLPPCRASESSREPRSLGASGE